MSKRKEKKACGYLPFNTSPHVLLVVAPVVEGNSLFHLSRQSNSGVYHMHVLGFAAVAGTQVGFRPHVAATGSGNEFLSFGD